MLVYVISFSEPVLMLFSKFNILFCLINISYFQQVLNVAWAHASLGCDWLCRFTCEEIEEPHSDDIKEPHYDDINMV